jgi:hypothetical protein
MTNQPVILVNPGGRPETDALEKNRDSGVYMYPYSLLFSGKYRPLAIVKCKSCTA